MLNTPSTGCEPAQDLNPCACKSRDYDHILSQSSNAIKVECKADPFGKKCLGSHSVFVFDSMILSAIEIDDYLERASLSALKVSRSFWVFASNWDGHESYRR